MRILGGSSHFSMTDPWDEDVYLPFFTYMYHKYQANVGEYTIHGSYGIGFLIQPFFLRQNLVNIYHKYEAHFGEYTIHG